MSRFRSTLERVPKVFRYLMVLGVIAFISLLFPSNVRFKYEFELGQNWKYEDLEAPFNYAIQKAESDIQQQIASLEQDFHPYYQVDPMVQEDALQAFQDGFNRQLQQINDTPQFAEVQANPQAYSNFGNRFLKGIYREGIIQVDEQHFGKGNDFLINLIRASELHTININSLPGVDDIQAILNDTLPGSGLEQADFLYPILNQQIKPNILYNDSLTQATHNNLMSSNIVYTEGMVRKGELIITRGTKINPEAYQKILSLKNQYEQNVTANKSRLNIFIGYFLLTSLIIGVFMLYLRNFAPDIFHSTVKLLFIFMWLILYSYLVNVIEKTDTLNAYLVPFCIVPIVIKTFYNARLALFTHIVIILIASFLSSQGYEFTFLQILAGIVVLLTDVDTREWTRFFYSILFIFLAYAVGYFGLSLVQEGLLTEINWSIYTWIFLNVILTLLAYPLIPLLERMFGFTSSITLVELSDMNRPLLRKLALEAPGTLQHSLQVANLSEAAARQIGADPLLVKVAALYHDIGKTKEPTFFIENQSGPNPHDDISYLDSARIIIGHIDNGVEMAKKARLPKLLINFIRTHHGTTRVEYFYRNYLKDHPDEDIDEQLFRYPGPLPTTKEETILMLADSIEAACRSLKSPKEGDLNNLIDKIISGKISLGQLDESTMTFQELETCKGIFKKIMRSVHHVRIEYPDEKQRQASPKSQE